MKRQSEQYLNRITSIIQTAKPATDSLFGGELALSLYYYYLYETTEDENHGQLAVEKLEAVLTAFNNGTARLHGAYYCNGLTGLFYLLVLYLQKGLLDRQDMHQELELLAKQLLTVALAGIEDDYNDFAHGAFGTLHSLILYAEVTGENRHLQPFLQKIEEKYLLSDQPWIPAYVVKQTEKLTVNFSLSHGQPGLLILLMKAYRLTGVPETVKNRLRRNIDYVVGFRNEVPDNGSANFFSSMIHPETKEQRTSRRLAWCYSDLGQVCLLHKAASFFNDEGYRNLAEEAGRRTTQRTDFESTLLESAQICHGTAGVAQIYYSLWKESGTTAYKTAGDYWIGQTFGHLEAELAADISDPLRSDIVEGLPGIGLVLMSHIRDHQLDWSNLILL